MTPDKPADKVRFLADHGMKTMEIAKTLGVTRQRVYALSRQHNIVISGSRARRNPDEASELRALLTRALAILDREAVQTGEK